MLCPSCAARILPGTTFCALCGAQLAPLPQPRTVPAGGSAGRADSVRTPTASATRLSSSAPLSGRPVVSLPPAPIRGPLRAEAGRPTIAPSPVIAVRSVAGMEGGPGEYRGPGDYRDPANRSVTTVVWVVAGIVLFLLAFGITVLVADGHSGLPLS